MIFVRKCHKAECEDTIKDFGFIHMGFSGVEQKDQIIVTREGSVEVRLK